MVLSYSKLSHRCCNQGQLPPSYNLCGSHSLLPGSKHGHSYLTYPWNQSKVVGMLNGYSWSYLQNCCYAKQLSMALLHVSHPPVQTCGGEDIPCIFFSISWTLWVLDSITNQYLGFPWLHPVTVHVINLFLKVISLTKQNDSHCVCVCIEGKCLKWRTCDYKVRNEKSWVEDRMKLSRIEKLSIKNEERGSGMKDKRRCYSLKPCSRLF